MFSLIRKVPICFFPVVENVLTQMRLELDARSKHWSVFLLRKNVPQARAWFGKKQHSPEP